MLVNFLFVVAIFKIESVFSYRVIPKIHKGVIPLTKDYLDQIFNPYNYTEQTVRHSSYDFINNDHQKVGPLYPAERRERRQGGKKPQETKCYHGFCENVENYPETKIRNALARTPNVDGYFKQPVTISLNNRGNFDSDESESICSMEQATYVPQKAPNLQGVERLIVNLDNYKQTVHMETCADGGKCKFAERFPSDYTSYCKQKFTITPLIVFEGGAKLGDRENITQDHFKIPSCCACVIKRIDRK